MHRLILVCILFLVCACVGFCQSEKIRLRYKNLCTLKAALGIVKTNIEFFGYDISRALRATEEKTEVKGLFCVAAKNIAEHGVQAAWSMAVRECSDELSLIEEDKETLILLGARLGMTDTEGQKKNIDAVCAMLDTNITSAKENMDRYCRLYSSGGVMVGLFLAIVLA